MATPLQAPWAILLCRHKDDPNDPAQIRIRDLAAQWRTQRDATFVASNLNATWDTDNRTILELYQTFFTITGLFTFNAVRYWDEMSHGNVYVGGSQVFPCILDRTIAQGATEAALPGGNYQNDTFKLAKSALLSQHGVNWRDYSGVAVSFQSPDFGAQGGMFDGGPGVFMDIRYVKNNGIQAWGQEMGHGFGLDHSRTDGEVDANGIGIDYTDPWDVMSTQRAFSASDNSYGMRGPGLNAWNMRSRKWLDESRIWRGPLNQNFRQIIHLRPLHKRQLPGLLGAELPAIGNHSKYLVELRVSDEWDAAIQYPKILIHRFEGAVGQFFGTHSYLMKGSNGQKALSVGDTFQSGVAPFSRVKVVSIDAINLTAAIEVSYSTSAWVKPSVKIDQFGIGSVKQKCRVSNIEGETIGLIAKLSGDYAPNPQILWAVYANGYPYSFQIGIPGDLIWVHLSHVLFNVLDVYVTVIFDDGTTITAYRKQTILSPQAAQWAEYLCSLTDERKLPIPWWQWDIATLRDIAKGYSPEQLSKIEKRTSEISQTIKRLRAKK